MTFITWLLYSFCGHNYRFVTNILSSSQFTNSIQLSCHLQLPPLSGLLFNLTTFNLQTSFRRFLSLVLLNPGSQEQMDLSSPVDWFSYPPDSKLYCLGMLDLAISCIYRSPQVCLVLFPFLTISDLCTLFRNKCLFSLQLGQLWMSPHQPFLVIHLTYSLIFM